MVRVMKLFYFAAAASAAAIVHTHSTTDVLANLQNIDRDIHAFATAVASWDGSLFGGLPMRRAERQLTAAVRTATLTATQSDAGASPAVEYLTTSLSPAAYTALQALQAQKGAVIAAGIAGPVANAMRNLQTDIDALGAALLKIAASDAQRSDAQAAIVAVDGHFAAAIHAFEV